MPDQTVAVENVGVAYGPKSVRVQALSGVTLNFVAGELTLVMGPSGSGKTTLLSLLGCLLTPDSGSVWIDGADVASLNERERTDLRKRKIGYIFQAFRLFHSLSAFENVMIRGEIGGSRNKQGRQAARKMLEDFGLGAKLSLKPAALSGGEKQRVAIARALLSNPRIVLADEPTASLDSTAGRQISEILRKLADEQGRTVVVVSHDPRWIGFSHRTVVLQDGRIVEDRRNT